MTWAVLLGVERFNHLMSLAEDALDEQDDALALRVREARRNYRRGKGILLDRFSELAAAFPKEMIEKLIYAGWRKSLAKPRQTSKNVPSASLFWGHFRVPEDDAYQTFLEDEFDFNMRLIAKGPKRLILQETSIFCKESATAG